MSPQERTQFGQYVQQQAQQQGTQAQGFGQGTGPEAYEDAHYLAQQATQLHLQQPGLLGQLLSGGGRNEGGGSAVSKLSSASATAAPNWSRRWSRRAR